MSPEKEEALLKKYPNMFENLSYGFEHDDGWYSIIDKGCEALMLINPNITVSQVKEKFGTLRFYVDPWEPPSAAHSYAESAIVAEMERRSAQTCEICGHIPAKQYGGGWVVTRCKKHAPADR